MLPTPSELREKVRVYREAAGKAASVEVQQQLAGCAAVLAQVAEAIERDRLGVNAEHHKRLIAETLERIGQPLPDEQESDPDERARIKRWQLRAEELRTIADGFADPKARASLRRAAANYDRLVDHSEAQKSDCRPGAPDKAG